ncbi:MAG: alpha/beta hydrolase [Bacteroidia bacterium]|nr:alpha/beta hydrolase [Bacteroidia bacterium]
MKKVYFISGLGADERAFSKLELPGITPHHIAWKIPVHNESIESYAGRMREEITEPDPVIVGLSFGGVIAVEIAKQISCKKIILISSIKHRNEKPMLFNLSAAAGLHKLLPMASFSKPNRMMYYFFGVHQNKRAIELLNELMVFMNPDYLKWAVNRIVNWENELIPPRLVHIHGTADKVLPAEKIKADYLIEKGSHFMIWTRARQVSEILQKEI